MLRQVSAVLILGYGLAIGGGAEASGIGLGYRPNDPVHTYCPRGPRWGYSAAYYQSYRQLHRAHRHKCRCP